MIKPHETHIFNQTQLVQLNIAVNNKTIKKLFEFAKFKVSPTNSTDHSSIFIQNEAEMRNVIQQSDEIVNAQRH